MTGYDIYSCWFKSKGYNIPSLETYLNNNKSNYFESLSVYFSKNGMTISDVRDFFICNINIDHTFDVFSSTEESNLQNYKTWKNTKSTEKLYFEEVKKSFVFLENFCINNNISLDEYQKTYAAVHIRERKIDWAVAVHLQLINIKKLKTVEKLLLKSFLKQYNIITNRLCNQKLSQLMSDSEEGMKRLLTEYNLC